MTKLIQSALLVLAIALSGQAIAQSAAGPVATVVTIKTPPGVTRATLDAGFQKSAPDYEKVPGLIRKYFTTTDDSFGGIYLWKNRAAADTWFNAAWHARVVKTYGVDGQVTYFDAPLVIEGTNAGGAK